MINFARLAARCSLVVLFISIVLHANAQNKASTAKDNFTYFTPENDYSDLAKLKALTPPSFLNHPDFGKCFANNNEWYEQIDKRTLRSRSYVDDGGEVITQYGYDNINYTDDNGWLVAVDTRLKPVNTGWAVTQQENPTYLYNDASTSLSIGNGQLITFNKNVQFNYSNINTNRFTVGDNGIKITNVVANTDKIIKFKRNTVETDYIINKPLKLNRDLVISEDIILSAGYSIYKNEKLTGSNEMAGALSVIGPDGKEKAVLKVPACYDKGKSETLGSYNLTKQAGGYRLEIIVPSSWLNDPARKYPVTIDPVVTGKTAQWAGGKIASCLYPNFGSGTLTVTIPARITITAFYVQSSYYANPLTSEVLEDGLVYFSTKCGSTGTYSVDPPKGDSSGTGVIALTDFHSSLSCCVHPSCTAQTLDVTMNLSRTAGGTDCDSQYIYYDPANTDGSPFEAYVVGNTVEENNSEWSVSPAALCSNNCTLILNATINYGVPPYTISHPWADSTKTVGKYDSTICSSTGKVSLTLNIPNCPASACDTGILKVPPPIIIDACGTKVQGLSNKIDTILPAPSVKAFPDSQTVCSGSKFKILFNSCLKGTTFTWSGADGSSGIDSPIVDSAVNIGSIAQKISYIIIPSSGSCTGIPDTVTVTILPNPSSKFSVNPAKICLNDTILVTYLGDTITGANYYWSFGGGTIISGSGAGPYKIIYQSPGPDSVRLIVSANGCTSTLTRVLFNVNIPPIVTVSPSGDTICAGVPIKLTASGASTYSWAPPSGLNVTNIDSVMAGPTVTTTYTVSGTDTNGCVGKAMDTVFVNPSPIIIVKALPVKICADSSSVLTASGGKSYVWSPATGLSATTGSMVTATPTATTKYTVKGTDSLGCSDTGSVIVFVNPRLPITVTPNNPKICDGYATVLTASGAKTYAWTPATGLSATSGSLVVANPTITSTYRVSSIDTLGCAEVDSFTLTVDSNPKIMVTPNPAIVCYGTSKLLTASGSTNYIWTPSSTLNSSTGDSVYANPTVAVTYTVIGTNTTGCSDTVEVTVSIKEIPHISVSPPTSKFCFGDSVTLIGSGGSTYTWTPSLGLNSSSGSSVVASPPSTTTYTVTGTDTNGCSDTANATVQIIPAPVITTTPANPEICIGGSINVLASGALTYTWSPTLGLSCTNCSNPVVDPTITSTYIIQGSNEVCKGYDTITVKVDSPPTLSISNDTTVCEDKPVQLLATSSAAVTWSPSAGLSCTLCNNPVATTDTTTKYVASVTNGACVVMDTAIITINTFTINAGSNQHIVYSKSAQLTATGGIHYLWKPSNSLSNDTISDPVSSPTITTTYYVTATDIYGCTSTDSVVVFVSDPCESLMVPNAFSPNGDGVNDYLHVLNVGVATLKEFKVFNRWGQMLYETSDIGDKGWDGSFNGKPQPVGTYVYYAEVICEGKTISLKGNAVLLR